MSEVISLRLGKENPRESKVNEILNAWFEKGFCTRNILTMALLEFDHPDSDLEPGPRIIYSPLFTFNYEVLSYPKADAEGRTVHQSLPY